MRPLLTRSAWIALPIALGALAIGASSASANSQQWGDNGSTTCTYAEGMWYPGTQANAELGTYCMQSVTGWIQINGLTTQNQQISCANNDSSSGLSYSLDGQSYVDAGPWYALAYSGSGDPDAGGPYNNIGWQTGNGGNASLTGEAWSGGVTTGSTATGTYGAGGASVTNWSDDGYWQTAIACVNAAGATQSGQSPYERTAHSMERPSTHVANASAPRARDRKIDIVETATGKASLAREYALKKNVTRTDTRTCPAGMVRKGKLAYTVQEFPANRKSPKWKDRSLVNVTMTPKGKNAGRVEMTLTRAKNPTVVQFQMRCVKA